MRNKALFTSLRGDWKTPKAVYQVLDSEFGFDHDPCPTNWKVDGLTSDWGDCNYVNPPYGKEIGRLVCKPLMVVQPMGSLMRQTYPLL